MPAIQVTYLLSEAGQKASLRAGGDGKRTQHIQVEYGSDTDAEALELAKIDSDGKAVVLCDSAWPRGYGDDIVPSKEYDAPPTIGELLADEKSRRLQYKQAQEARQRECERKERQRQADWCALPLMPPEGQERRIDLSRLYQAYADGFWYLTPYNDLIKQTPEYDEACAERSRLNQLREEEQNRQREADAAAKQAAIAQLREWALLHGSDLLRARIEDGFDWQSLAERAWAEAQFARLGLSEQAPDPFEDYKWDDEERTCPTLEEIVALRRARQLTADEPATAELVWVTYTEKSASEDDDYPPEDPAEIKRAELKITITCPTGRKIPRYFLPEAIPEPAARGSLL